MKKPEAVEVPANVVDLEEMILGKEEYAKRRASFPDGVGRKVTKLTAEDRAKIKAAKYVKVSELAKHFKVSPTTIANIRKADV